MAGILQFNRLTLIKSFCLFFVFVSSFVENKPLCKFNMNASGETWTDCSYQKLSSDSINISVSTTHLILSHNLIRTIKPGHFTLLKNLTYLDISNNLLKTLHPALFTGLTKLTVLNISGNNLSSKSSFPKGVFKPLSSSLLELDMRHNLIDLRITQGMYPEEALSDLRVLKVLKIDCMRGKNLLS